MTDTPYSLWDTRRSLGVYRDMQPVYKYWTPFFQGQVNSEDEYIDFEKLPVRNRRLAALTMPLARGKPVYSDSTKAFRVKPAYVKVEDQVDPLAPLKKRAGIDMPIMNTEQLSPMQRLNLLKIQMTIEHVTSIERRWDWLAAKAIIDGKVVLKGENYPETLVDFQRDPNHTVILGSGDRFGDSGVSALDFIQAQVDKMTQAEFGAIPTRITMGGAVWGVLRKDEEFLKHMDTNIRGGNITIERGLVSGERVFKVGEMLIGGQSGQTIELWVNNDTFEDPDTGVETRFIASNEMVFTGTADSINGFQCFGRIIDRAAQYAPIPIFPRNWLSEGDPQVEYLTHKSSPLMVPVNPNATLKATVLAPQ